MARAAQAGDADLFPLEIMDGLVFRFGHQPIGDPVCRRPERAGIDTAQSRADARRSDAGLVIEIAGDQRRHGGRRAHENDFNVEILLLEKFPLARRD